MTAEQQPVRQPQPSLGSEEFKAIFRHHPAGVCVVTSATPDGPAGFTATSVISVAAEPAMFAFSVAAGSTSRRILDTAPSVAVNFLAEGQAELARRFAARGTDRFAGLDYSVLPTGEPVLPGTMAWVRGIVEQRIPVGDSLLITLRAVRAHHATDGHLQPLVYLDRSFPRLEA